VGRLVPWFEDRVISAKRLRTQQLPRYSERGFSDTTVCAIRLRTRGLQARSATSVFAAGAAREIEVSASLRPWPLSSMRIKILAAPLELGYSK